MEKLTLIEEIEEFAARIPKPQVLNKRRKILLQETGVWSSEQADELSTALEAYIDLDADPSLIREPVKTLSNHLKGNSNHNLESIKRVRSLCNRLLKKIVVTVDSSVK